MRLAVAFVGLTACGFQPSAMQQTGDGGNADGTTGDGNGSAVPDAQPVAACGWTFAHTNFDPCMLATSPTPFDITTDTTIDPTATSARRTTVVQGDGTTIVVFHVSELSVATVNTLTLNNGPNVAGFVFAVEGNVTLSGNILVAAGTGDPTHCATSTGADGVDSSQFVGGAGGGGGGAGADSGGDGTDGAGGGAGARGARGAKVSGASSLSPLRGGCAGGNGGQVHNGSGNGTVGGRGGGAIEISARGTITISGEIDAAGRGGGTSSKGGEGGGGGGAGGGILLEAPMVTISGRICADGGSGAEGGNATSGGTAGQTSPCTVTAGAVTATITNSVGGAGGNGGFAGSTSGSVAGGANTSGNNGGGGGGGGGGVGWIRVHATTPTTGGQISPVPLVD
jgi:hypothetical protein